MSKKNTSKKTAKVMTPKELKAWLQGVMDFQPADWVPSAEQWKALCERIMQLEETEFETQYVGGPQVSYGPQWTAAAPAAYPVNRGPSTLEVGVAVPFGGAAHEVDNGKVAVAIGTGTGIMSASKEGAVIEGEYKSPF